jgi:signal transduction histidine kinase
MFRLQAVRDMLPERTRDAMAALETALERGDQAIAEGRAAVQGLRASPLVSTDLHEALRALGEEVIPQEGTRSAHIRVLVEGRPRTVAPLIRDEIYRIAREALSNAARHANARNIEAELEYASVALHLRVRDDGTGIDQNILERGRRPGHWGLQGMRERALAIGGRLQVWSELGAGTEVELVIPADIAYGRRKATAVPDATSSDV